MRGHRSPRAVILVRAFAFFVGVVGFLLLLLIRFFVQLAQLFEVVAVFRLLISPLSVRSTLGQSHRFVFLLVGVGYLLGRIVIEVIFIVLERLVTTVIERELLLVAGASHR